MAAFCCLLSRHGLLRSMFNTLCNRIGFTLT
jgi:hypothetical protein